MQIAIDALNKKLDELHNEEREQHDELLMALETEAALRRRRINRLTEIGALEEAVTKLGGKFETFVPAGSFD